MIRRSNSSPPSPGKFKSKIRRSNAPARKLTSAASPVATSVSVVPGRSASSRRMPERTMA